MLQSKLVTADPEMLCNLQRLGVEERASIVAPFDNVNVYVGFLLPLKQVRRSTMIYVILEVVCCVFLIIL